MERKEVTISLTNEEVKEVFEIFLKERKRLKVFEHVESYAVYLKRINNVLDNLSRNEIVLDENNSTYLITLIISKKYPVLYYDQATIVYELAKRMVAVYNQLRGEAHE